MAPPASSPSTYPFGRPHWLAAFSITVASPRDTVPKNRCPVLTSSPGVKLCGGYGPGAGGGYGPGPGCGYGPGPGCGYGPGPGWANPTCRHAIDDAKPIRM